MQLQTSLVCLWLLSLGACAHSVPSRNAPPPVRRPVEPHVYPQNAAIAAEPRQVVLAPSPEQFRPTDSALVGAVPSSEAAAESNLWQDGVPDKPAPSAATELTAPDLYVKLRDSVFLIIAGKSYDDIVARRGSRTVGSAVAVHNKRLITNCHVINGFDAILAYGKSGFMRVTKYRADESTDRCALAIEDGREAVPVPGVRSVDDLRVGERVYTVGSPEGIESTLGEGIISGLHEVTGLKLIQTTAQISRGSSGGGLFDTRGNLIGITTLKHVRGESLNFAIPADAFFRK